MFITIIFSLLLALLDCASARVHTHQQLKDAEVTITAWNGCTINGSIAGQPVTLFMDVASCPLHAKVPGKFRIRYDPVCSAVLEITDGPAITTPMPPACPSPTASPTPTPLPLPSPAPTPTPGTILDIQGRVIDQMNQSIEGALVMGFNRTVLSRAGDGYFQLDDMPVGTAVTALKAGYTFNIVTVAQGVDEQLYFVRGTLVSQPTPTPSPTPKPSPSPTATPTPAPTPQPSPTPGLPTCRRDEVVGSPPRCVCVGQLVGNPRRCKPRP